MVKKILTIGALAAVLSLQTYADCPEVKPEINKIFSYKGTWYVKYIDIPSAPTLGNEELKVNGVLDRTVSAGSHDPLGDRLFPLTSTYNPEICNEAVITAFDDDGNNVSQSNVFRFGDLTTCVISKPEVKKIFEYKNVWYIKYTDLRSNHNLANEQVMVDGVLDREVSAGSYDPLADRAFALTGTYDASTCHTAKIVAYNDDNSTAATSDTFFFGDTSTCVCETP